MISVLCPSRGRAGQLMDSYKSFGDQKIEFLVAVDKDDPQLEDYKKMGFNLTITEPLGYHNMDKYMNLLAAKSTGEWLFNWNDDARMTGYDLNELVKHLNPSEPIVVLFAEDKRFPMISRGLYELIGHFAAGPSVDSYIHAIGTHSGIIQDLQDIGIIHDTPSDAIAVNRDFKKMDERMSSNAVVKQRLSDVDRIKRFARLSILIATAGNRSTKFQLLVQKLSEQIKEHKAPVEIIAYWNTGDLSIGAIRQALVDEALGEYVCFIDDDDGVPDYYIAEIMANLGKDYVGFEVQMFNDGEVMPRIFHSIRYGIWHQDEQGYFRGITHLNPIKRSLALKSRFDNRGMGEDESWAVSLTPFVRTENYINKIMYYYYHNSKETFFGGSKKDDKVVYHRPTIDSPYFRYHPKSKKKGKYGGNN